MYPSLLHFIAVNHLVLGAYAIALLGASLFLRGLQLFARKRARGCVPSISVSAATAGPATVSGAASGVRTLTAPITGRKCFIYQTSIWQMESAGDKWKNVAEETGHLTFLVEDPTGKLSVEPCGAELNLRQSFREDYALPSPNPAANQDAIPEHVGNFLARNGVALNRPTRVEECCLLPGSPVFVTGTLTENLEPAKAQMSGLPAIAGTNGIARSNQAGSAANPNLPALATPPEVIRLGSGTSPSTTLQMTQQAKIAAALSRAGLAPKTDVWATPEASLPSLSSVEVREKTQSDPSLMLRATAAAADSTVDPPSGSGPSPDSTPPRFSVTKGTEGSLFVISNYRPEITMALGWQSISLVILGSSLSTVGTGMVLVGHLHWIL